MRGLLAARRGLSTAAEALKFRFEFTKPAVEVMPQIPPLTCGPETTALEAAEMMTTENRHHILVMSSTTGRLAGLLTERDFLTKLPLARGAARATAVTELMTPSYDLILGSANCSFEQVVRRMRKDKISSFPLVDDAGVTTNVVTKKQIATQIFNALEEGRREGLCEADVSVGEMLDYHAAKGRPGDVRGTAVSLPPYVSVAEAVGLMRKENSGSLSIFAPPFATHSSFVLANNFGLFTEREHRGRAEATRNGGLRRRLPDARREMPRPACLQLRAARDAARAGT